MENHRSRAAQFLAEYSRRPVGESPAYSAARRFVARIYAAIESDKAQASQDGSAQLSVLLTKDIDETVRILDVLNGENVRDLVITLLHADGWHEVEIDASSSTTVILGRQPLYLEVRTVDNETYEIGIPPFENVQQECRRIASEGFFAPSSRGGVAYGAAAIVSARPVFMQSE